MSFQLEERRAEIARVVRKYGVDAVALEAICQTPGCDRTTAAPSGPWFDQVTDIGSWNGLEMNGGRAVSLDLSGCDGLQALPERLGDLAALETLDLWGCTGLQALPERLAAWAAVGQTNTRISPQELAAVSVAWVSRRTEAPGAQAVLNAMSPEGFERAVWAFLRA